MAEPVPGIEALADESNARYFKVKVAGPKDVRTVLHLFGSQFRVKRERLGSTSKTDYKPTNTYCFSSCLW